MKILTIFGTRPEVIKLAPVIRELEAYRQGFQTVNVTSAQHTDLLYPCSRVLASLDPILVKERPDLILVQGDTTTALAGALAGFHQRIPVGHVEAGLRSGNVNSPYPEEMNRQLITRLATYHFAATPGNREILLAEGVAQEKIFVTGNPVVDSLKTMLEQSAVSLPIQELLKATKGLKRIVLTTHRRENFGQMMAGNLRILRSFVEHYEDIALLFPVHPNPTVVGLANLILCGHPRIYLIEPLNYEDFIVLLSRVWLIVSDSGGVQEEAPTLGKPLLILRENTERPEAVESGVARLVGGRPERLKDMLEEIYHNESWSSQVGKIENPFGRGDSGKRIVQTIAELLGVSEKDPCRV
jgi:UDP-N-acetylglucosamine 2-epimerase (non-hydrolysing)